jgi:hypothetical protein
LREFSPEGDVYLSSLYNTPGRKDGIFCCGSAFNGRHYAELDYFNGDIKEVKDAYLKIQLFGGSREELDLIKENLEKTMRNI